MLYRFCHNKAPKVSKGALSSAQRHFALQVADAAVMQLPAASYDVIFSNWLLMYLADAEVQSLASRMLTWLRDDGVVFFRESCFRQSGDKKRKANPTHYRYLAEAYV